MTFEPSPPPRAIIIGSSGGLGGALARHLTQRGFAVTGLSRSFNTGAAVVEALIDLGSEESIEAAANRLRDRAPYQLIIVATGLLHDDHVSPEKTYRDLNQASLLKYFAINAAGPALVAKHFIPLLPRNGHCLFAALSARVGSIGDNRLGGWYGYRAAKAALNMLIKTLAIEVSRTRPEAICVGLHPGTVDTRLSKPFQKGVAAGRLISADQAAERLLDVIGNLAPAQSGKCFAWDGKEIGP